MSHYASLVIALALPGATDLDLPLPGGARLLFELEPELPLGTYALGLRTLASDENRRDIDGATALALEVLLASQAAAGPGTLSERLASLGTHPKVSPVGGGLVISGAVATRSLGPALSELLLALGSKRLDAAAFERTRPELVALRRHALENDRALGLSFLRTTIFGAHPYARDPLGTPRSLDAVTLAETRTALDKLVVPSRLVLGVSAGGDPRALAKAVADDLGRWPSSVSTSTSASTGAPVFADPPPPLLSPEGLHPGPGRRIVLVDKPDRAFAQVYIGQVGLPAADVETVPLLVANAAFGGAVTGRLAQEIRVRLGYSRGAFSYLGRNRAADAFVVWSFPSSQNLIRTVRRTLEMLETLARGGLTDAEAGQAAEYVARQALFRIDTPSQRARERVEATLLGLPPNDALTLPARARAVAVKDANAAVAKLLRPEVLDGLVIVIVASSTPELRAELAKVPGVKDVVVASYSAL